MQMILKAKYSKILFKSRFRGHHITILMDWMCQQFEILLAVLLERENVVLKWKKGTFFS